MAATTIFDSGSRDATSAARRGSPPSSSGRVLRGLRLHVGRVAPGPRRAVELRPVIEGLLARIDIRAFALPRLEGRRLQRAAVGEAELPRAGTQAVHGVEVRGRLLV